MIKKSLITYIHNIHKIFFRQAVRRYLFIIYNGHEINNTNQEDQ